MTTAAEKKSRPRGFDRKTALAVGLGVKKKKKRRPHKPGIEPRFSFMIRAHTSHWAMLAFMIVVEELTQLYAGDTKSKCNLITD